MLRPPRRTVRRSTLSPHVPAVGALLAAGAVLLTGCGSNGVAAESNEHSVETAANGQVGSVLIRNAQIILGSTPGSSALALTLYEQGSNPDTLTSVTSTQATGFVLPTLGAAGGTSPVAATSVTAVALPVMSAVSLDNATDEIAISGLAGMPQVGDTIPVTFGFTGAGTVTLDVPVVGDQPGSPSPLPTVTDANVANGPSSLPSIP